MSEVLRDDSSLDKGWVTLTLSNPGKLNAISVAMWRALRAIRRMDISLPLALRTTAREPPCMDAS